MYAIVDIQGQQFRVEKDQEIFVHRLEAQEGAQLDFDKVMLLDSDGKIQVGAPFISGAKISAKVISHNRGDKVLVFKKKRRKGYQTLNGHRQDFTKIMIEKITAKSAAPKAVKEEASPEVNQ